MFPYVSSKMTTSSIAPKAAHGIVKKLRNAPQFIQTVVHLNLKTIVKKMLTSPKIAIQILD
jgi:hypothetical protein